MKKNRKLFTTVVFLVIAAMALSTSAFAAEATVNSYMLNMREGQGMEYTIIGDTVNTASRIESLCKTYRTDILLSEASAAHLEAPLRGNLHFVDDASIRGKEDKIKLYTAG